MKMEIVIPRGASCTQAGLFCRTSLFLPTGISDFTPQELLIDDILHISRRQLTMKVLTQ
jgi:hypothetical protein